MKDSSFANVSKSVISRLPRYYRFLTMLQEDGVERISSSELSQLLGTTSSQIRQDFNCFGPFGQQGYGYNVEQLKSEISRIIGLDNRYKIILIGAGNLGNAIATHFDFTKKGFELVGIFDISPKIIGKTIADLVVTDFEKIDEFCAQNSPTAAILTMTEGVVKQVVQRLIDNGVTSFWNFSHYDINGDFKDVIVQNVHLNDSLMTLCYDITNRKSEKE